MLMSLSGLHYSGKKSKHVAALYCVISVAVTNNGELFWCVFVGFKYVLFRFSILGFLYECRIIHIKLVSSKNV
jgi:hypothetical protein